MVVAAALNGYEISVTASYKNDCVAANVNIDENVDGLIFSSKFMNGYGQASCGRT